MVEDDGWVEGDQEELDRITLEHSDNQKLAL